MFGAAQWMIRVAEFAVGFSTGVMLPTQQIVTAETMRPKQRPTFGVLNYVLFSLGTLLAFGLHRCGLDVRGLCIVSAVLALPHFIAAGFFHPETPRFLFTKDKKTECVDALQWLRGHERDIGVEYTEMADTIGMLHREGNSAWQIYTDRSVLFPVLLSATLMTLTALSGLLPVSFLLISGFELEHRSAHMTGLLLTINVVSPCAALLLVHRVGRKMLILISTSAMTASLLFLALLSHFQDISSFGEDSFGWTLQAAAVMFVVAHQCGCGPLSWVVMTETLPCRALEAGVALASACWWAFNLALSMTLRQLYTTLTPTGVFWLHAVVCALAYGFALLFLPDVRRLSLEEIERYYAKITNADKGFRFRTSTNL